QWRAAVEGRGVAPGGTAAGRLRGLGEAGPRRAEGPLHQNRLVVAPLGAPRVARNNPAAPPRRCPSAPSTCARGIAIVVASRLAVSVRRRFPCGQPARTGPTSRHY